MADLLIGKTLANYRIERLLGRGGMASVYYGFDSQLQRPAAIKIIDERFSGDTSYAARFVREARAMASWRHPNIPRIYQAGVENGIYFYAMEYIHGMNLEELLHQTVQISELLPFGDVLRYGKAIAEALDYAHLNGAIHRDVKPSNVLIAEDGRIMLTDFGLVLQVDKGTQGEVFGSPLYISPEQARSSAGAVPQSDVYSLGVILYEMVVGHLPFEDESLASLAIKHITLEPPAPRLLNPDLSPEVEAVLLKALRKAPKDRYQTGKDLMLALEEGIGPQTGGKRIYHPVVAPPDTVAFLPTYPDILPQSTSLELETKEDAHSDTNLEASSPETNNLKGTIPGVVVKKYLPAPNRRYILAAVLAVSFLALLCIFVFGSIWLYGRLKSPSTANSSTPSPTLLAAQLQATSGAATSKDAIPTTTTTFDKYQLSFSLQKTDSLLIVNNGTVDIPLAQLRLEAQKNKLVGTEWGIDVLRPGECVTVLKKEGHSEPPTGTGCNLVGKNLTRSGPSKFWDSAFDVYFQNILVASCDLGNTSCDLQISKSP